MHPAHRIADHQAQVPDAEAFGNQAILRQHHVVVVVAREFRLQSVRWLRRFSGAERVRQDDEIFRGVERLTRAEQLTRESRCQHAARRARGAMQHEHRLAGRLPMVV